MARTLLPRIQLVLIVLFAAMALCGPAVAADFRTLLLIVAAVGVLLGAVTFWIGWRAAVEKKEVDYPFAGWSAAILRRFLPPRQARGLRTSPRALSPAARSALGIASLAAGGLLVIGLIVGLIVVRP